MKKSAKKLIRSASVINHLTEEGTYTDNELETSLTRVSFSRLLEKAGFRKFKGDPLIQVMFSVLIWPLLENKSISCFCGKVLSVFLRGGKNVIYDFQKREDLRWRELNMLTAKKIYVDQKIKDEEIKAFVFDDTIKQRCGKKVESSSCHKDHVTNSNVMGQQILTMGLACSRAFLSIDSQIYVSSSRVVKKTKEFQNPRSSLAKNYGCAVRDDKNTMLKQMLKRGLAKGFQADYVLADSWFGNKKNIKAVRDNGLHAIFRMKKSNLKYRINGTDFNATGIYHMIRHKCKKLKSQPWKTFMVEVELNLDESGKKEQENWITVHLLFVLPKEEKKGEFALFLSTDLELSKKRVLEIYSLRWGIEVYFKEVKQNLGFLREQTGNYACHYASIHLSAIRYLLFLEIMLHQGGQYFGQVRSKIASTLEHLTFANLLWGLFRSLIYGVLDQFQEKLGMELLGEIKDSINERVTEFLTQALQLDSATLAAEARQD